MIGNPLLNAEYLLGAIVFFSAVFGIYHAAVKWVTGQIDRAVTDVEHLVSAVAIRTTTLENRASNDRERIVRIEATIEAIKDGQERIEKKLDALALAIGRPA